MTLFLQASAAILLAVILVLTLGSQGKEFGTVLAIAVCCMVSLSAISYLRPVIDFLQSMESLGGLDSSMVAALLKITGIGIISEISNLVCADAGSSSLGKTMQFLGAAVILWLSLPLFTALIELLQKIMGEL